MINEHEAAIVRTTTEVITATFTTMSVAKPTHVQIPAAPYTLLGVEQNPNAFSAILKLSDPSASSNFTQDISPLSLTVSYETPYRVRVCISDHEGKRWRVPPSVVEVDGPHDNNKEFGYKFKYNVHEDETFAGFSVSRQKPREEVFVKKTKVYESDSCSGKALFDCINEKFVFKD
ncbi:3698_t:CDS:1, partial [Paraglomus brasilianum]